MVRKLKFQSISKSIKKPSKINKLHIHSYKYYYIYSIRKIYEKTNLKSSAGASVALLLYIEDILSSWRVCQWASCSGSALRRFEVLAALDGPGAEPEGPGCSSERPPVALFVLLIDILISVCSQPTCSPSHYAFALGTWQQHCISHILLYIVPLYTFVIPGTRKKLSQSRQ